MLARARARRREFLTRLASTPRRHLLPYNEPGRVKKSAFDQDLPRFGVSKPETTLFPRELILRQPAARIENRNFVREALAPFPKHEILIRRRRPRRKTRNENASLSGVD